MPSLHFGNFDCEHEWADPRWVPPDRVRRVNAELATGLVGACDPGDAILVGGAVESDHGAQLADAGLPSVRFVSEPSDEFTGWRLKPWGWTATAESFASAAGLVGDAPDPVSVRRVNSRSFAFALEEERGARPAGARLVRSRRECSEVVAGRASRQRWVLKAEFGMSARERMLGEGARCDESLLAWLDRRLARDGCVVFELWLDVVAEAGVQWTVRSDGSVALDGVVPLLTDRVGRYLGTRVLAEGEAEADWSDEVEATRDVARQVAAAGYHGPLGIDVCCFLDGNGRFCRRFAQDVNARRTMGRLALGFARSLGPGAWLHVRWPDSRPDEWLRGRLSGLPSGVRWVRTSPFQLDGQPVRHGSLYVAGEDGVAVESVVERLVNSDTAAE